MDVYNKMANSLKWSSITEVLVKIITPISNMILARLLSPEEFGVIATITMVTSFTDVLTDAGFQKYIVQHEFKHERDFNNSTNVAFWSNLTLSFIIWFLIIIFREPVATLVGSPGLGKAIAIAGISIPLTSFSSIQGARLKRNFRFQNLFAIRFGGLLIPLIITVPLAALNLSYWSLIIGTIIGNLYNAILMTIVSKWKPTFYYKISLFKEMFSYCAWTLCDSLCVWLTAWIDIFFIGNVLDSYYLGLYKNSLSTVNGIFTLISASITPVLFAALSRLQDDKPKMVELFQMTQVMLSVFTVPLGIGIYIYRDFVTGILLGAKWEEASFIIGIWALACVCRETFVRINSELYRASGRPKMPFFLQMLDLTCLLPVCIYGLRIGFWNFVILRAVCRLDLIIPNFIILKTKYNAKYKGYIPVFGAVLVAAGIMALLGLWSVHHFTNNVVLLISIIVCMIVYFGLLALIPCTRNELKKLISAVRKE